MFDGKTGSVVDGSVHGLDSDSRVALRHWFDFILEQDIICTAVELLVLCWLRVSGIHKGFFIVTLFSSRWLHFMVE
jgi:hypothetical protein